ncbi:MAG TPA: FHA domain-containing protein, partial [Gemmataceae bacterium]|nr:FHA domain-containing protein [Gemmataceae bacterium]
MKPCSHCLATNADGDRFCKQCGRPLEAAAGASDKTVRWTGQPVPPVTSAAAPPAFRGAVPVAELFAGKERLVIGRAPDCDICLPHPMVSRYHALLERLPHGLRLRDLASVNGVSVAGRRITEPVLLGEGERVGVGPFLFTLKEGVVHTLDSSRSLRLEARRLEKVIALGGGKTRKLLDDVNLVVHPGEFVSLLGPSGSGKSTLMDCLNGRRRATGGQVLANGEDFYRHFDNFRQSLGYVP